MDVLIVERDELIGTVLADALDQDGLTATLVPDEQEAIVIVLDEHAHGWQQQQLLPNQVPEQPHVIGYRHDETVGPEPAAVGFAQCLAGGGS